MNISKFVSIEDLLLIVQKKKKNEKTSMLFESRQLKI